MIVLNDDGVGLGLLMIGLVFLVFGVTLVFAAYEKRDHHRLQYPRWHHKRFMAYSFEFWLGNSMLMGVAVVDMVLGFTILRTPGEVAVGWIVFFVIAVFSTLMAAKHWARDNLPEVLR